MSKHLRGGSKVRKAGLAVAFLTAVSPVAKAETQPPLPIVFETDIAGSSWIVIDVIAGDTAQSSFKWSLGARRDQSYMDLWVFHRYPNGSKGLSSCRNSGRSEDVKVVTMVNRDDPILVSTEDDTDPTNYGFSCSRSAGPLEAGKHRFVISGTTDGSLPKGKFLFSGSDVQADARSGDDGLVFDHRNMNPQTHVSAAGAAEVATNASVSVNAGGELYAAMVINDSAVWAKYQGPQEPSNTHQ